MFKKSLALIGAIGVLSSGIIGADLYNNSKRELPFPKIKVSFENNVVPTITPYINETTGKIDLIYERVESENIVICAFVDEKRNFADKIFNRPRIKRLELIVNSDTSKYVGVNYDGEPIIGTLPIGQEYEIFLSAYYSNNEERTMSSGIDENIISMYKVK